MREKMEHMESSRSVMSGGERASRAQAVFIREEDECQAMAWKERAKVRFKNFVTGKKEEAAEQKEKSTDFQAGDEEASATKGIVQYRLEAKDQTKQISMMRRICTCNGLIGGRRATSAVSVGVSSNPSQKLAMSLHWMFRVNFVFLFAVMCVAFFGLVILFAGFITAAGTVDPECVRIGGEEFAYAGAAFADAFALSWTTFSTVGYGSTYPALGYQNSNWSNCFFISFLCSLEALVGVLYSGFCGAILFGKVLRIQSQAQVIFSDPLVIRYGRGVMADELHVEHDDGPDAKPKNPCPVLEFRIVNRLFHEPGGEIMDASLNVVANVDADDADANLLDNSTDSMSERVGSTTSLDNMSESGSYREDTTRSQDSAFKYFSRRILNLGRNNDVQAIDEDPSNRLVGKHIFSKMMIEASDHPFFKRVWLARHVLDEHSPLLTPKVRRAIRRNDGAWPDKLNSHAAIRDALQFNQILVSLNGVSNVSASDVYAQKIYDYVDVNIGYQFVNILYREGDDTGALGVDIDLINDVREQSGGGGEPLIIE